MPLIYLRGIKKTFKQRGKETHVLNGIDLDIYEGEFLIIMGPSGSGKSTLLDIIAGLDHPSSGEFSYKGYSMDHVSSNILALYRQRVIGIVFQKYNLLRKLSAKLNIALPRILSSIKEKHIDFDSLSLLLDINLKEKGNTAVERLSIGQQQRVAIARAIVNDPEIILADEPTGNLDSENSLKIIEILKRINQEKKKTVVLVTHNESFKPYADRVIYLKDGAVEKTDMATDKKEFKDYKDNILQTQKPTKVSFVTLLNIAIKSITSNKQAIFVTIGQIVISVVVIIVIVGFLLSSNGYYSYFDIVQGPNQIFLSSTGKNSYYLPISSAPNTFTLTGRPITSTDIFNISNIPGVKSVYPSIPFKIDVQTNSGNITMYGYSGPPVSSYSKDINVLTAGSYFSKDDENSVIIPPNFADKLFPGVPYQNIVGQTLQANISLIGYPSQDNTQVNKSLVIKGILWHASEIDAPELPYNFNNIITSGVIKQYPLLIINAQNQSNISGIEAVTKSEGFFSTSQSELDTFIKGTLYGILLIDIVCIGFAVIGLLLGFFILASLTISQKVKEIAILMAIGSRQKDIRNYIIIQSIFLGILIAIIGTILGIITITVFSHIINVIFLPGTGYTDYTVMWVSIPALATIGIFTVLASFLESIFLALQTSSSEKMLQTLKRDE